MLTKQLPSLKKKKLIIERSYKLPEDDPQIIYWFPNSLLLQIFVEHQAKHRGPSAEPKQTLSLPSLGLQAKGEGRHKSSVT